MGGAEKGPSGALPREKRMGRTSHGKVTKDGNGRGDDKLWTIADQKEATETRVAEVREGGPENRRKVLGFHSGDPVNEAAVCRKAQMSAERNAPRRNDAMKTEQ